MKKINIHDKADIHAEGILSTKHCKPVICVDTGEVYTSATDAAEAAGVSIGNMSSHLTGRYRTVKGKRYCYLSKVTESLDTIVTRLRETSSMEADAQKWREHQAEQEKLRKLQEEQRKAKEQHDAKVAKARAKVERCNEICNRIEAQLAEAESNLVNAMHELNVLEGNVKVEEKSVA